MELPVKMNHYMAGYHAWLRDLQYAKLWYLRCFNVSSVFSSESLSQEGDINPFTKQPHTKQYHTILEARKKLPVYAQMDDFLKIVSHDPVRFEEGLRMLLLVIGRPSSAITFPLLARIPDIDGNFYP